MRKGQDRLHAWNICFVFFIFKTKRKETLSYLLIHASLSLCSPSSSGSSSYGSTSNSFIFSLRNKEGLAPFKRMVARPQYAIYRYSSYGPTFGYGFDIYIADNANTNRHSHTAFGEYGTYTVPSGVKEAYTILAGAKNFSPDDWEVFYRQ